MRSIVQSIQCQALLALTIEEAGAGGHLGRHGVVCDEEIPAGLGLQPGQWRAVPGKHSADCTDWTDEDE